jgi:hypothetical protein
MRFICLVRGSRVESMDRSSTLLQFRMNDTLEMTHNYRNHTACVIVRKPQLTRIHCSHVIDVCQHINFDVCGFIDERYNTAHLLNTWSGQFHYYGDQ